MPTPLIIGHRGASAVAPENTMAAFSAAIETGADGVEFDVRLSSDGVPVIIHDDTLKRTGNLNKRVVELSAAQLRKTNVGSWFSKKNPKLYASEGVPRLIDLFDLYQSTTGLLYLEMKSAPAQRDELATACCRLIQEYSLTRRVIMECFDHSALKIVKDIDSSIRTAALFEPRRTLPRSLFGKQIVEQALATGADEVALNFRLVNRRVVASARALGLRIVVWTVDDPRWLFRCIDLGIEVLITNDPATMLEKRDKASTH